MFEGKVVWITGGSSGIGKAFAEELHAKGAKLVLSALTPEELEPVIANLPGAKPLAFDVARFDILPSIVEEAKRAFGRIDVLINNAGITQRALAKNTEFSVYQHVIDVDLMAPIALTQLVTPIMRRQGSGRIIAVSSVAGKFGSPLRTAYCAAKHGVFGYFDSLRSEVIHDGIEVNVVAPGAVRTNLARNALTGEGQKFGKSDQFIEGGYDPNEMVKRALSQIENGRREVIIARGMEGMANHLRKWFPERAFDRIAAATPGAVRQLRDPDQST